MKDKQNDDRELVVVKIPKECRRLVKIESARQGLTLIAMLEKIILEYVKGKER